MGGAVTLTDPGKIYVIHLPHGGVATVDLSAARGPPAAVWFNPRSGAFDQPPAALAATPEWQRRIQPHRPPSPPMRTVGTDTPALPPRTDRSRPGTQACR